MGNEEHNQNQNSHSEKSELSHLKTSLADSTNRTVSTSETDNSEDIEKLKKQLRDVQDQLAICQAEKQQNIEDKYTTSETLFKEKREALETAKGELSEKIQLIIAINSDLEDKNQKIAHLEEELKQIKGNYLEKLNEKIEQTVSLEVELKETKNVLTSVQKLGQENQKKFQDAQTTIKHLQKTVEASQFERDAYLDQIAKLQDIIHQTEEDIKEIEAGHLEIQDQLHAEINRLESRTGQMSEDLKRETKGVLARDRHIRAVLQQTELGRILLFLVDYFENTKKKSLKLGTISTEVGIAPIRTRTLLRHLHELAVCEFNEVSKEIRLMRNI
ncbi:MAG: hypothetical protein ACXAC8_07175 [Candidatus Hodarchaeales archaeon]